MSSYDSAAPVSGEQIITPSQFKESMRLVRLQIAIPISVLIAMGANLVCALAIKPGLSTFSLPCRSRLMWGSHNVGGINALNPTLLSPNSMMIGLYTSVMYVLQGTSSFCSALETVLSALAIVGFCLLLLLVRKEVTKVSRVFHWLCGLTHDQSRRLWFMAWACDSPLQTG